MSNKQDLREKTDFREYVRWEALPRWRRKEEGLPMTQKAWAKQHGYSARTMQNWKNREEYDELMGELTDQWVKDSVPQVVKTAKEVATTPEASGHNDRKLILDLAGMGGTKMTIQHEGEVEHLHSVEDARTMDEGELRKAFRTELRKNPRFSEASDEELDGLIEAFVDASGEGGRSLPAAGEGAEKTPEYVISDTPDSTQSNGE